MEKLVAQTIKPKMRQVLLQSYKDVKYVITERDWEDPEVSGRFQHRFISLHDQSFRLFKVLTRPWPVGALVTMGCVALLLGDAGGQCVRNSRAAWSESVGV